MGEAPGGVTSVRDLGALVRGWGALSKTKECGNREQWPNPPRGDVPLQLFSKLPQQDKSGYPSTSGCRLEAVPEGVRMVVPFVKSGQTAGCPCSLWNAVPENG